MMSDKTYFVITPSPCGFGSNLTPPSRMSGVIEPWHSTRASGIPSRAAKVSDQFSFTCTGFTTQKQGLSHGWRAGPDQCFLTLHSWHHIIERSSWNESGIFTWVSAVNSWECNSELWQPDICSFQSEDWGINNNRVQSNNVSSRSYKSPCLKGTLS